MARKSMNQTKNVRRRPMAEEAVEEGNFSIQSSRKNAREYGDILKEFITSPAVKYVAGGIAAAVLARIANNISDRYPELSHFLKENLDTVEGKLGEIRSSMGESTRH